MYHYIYASLMNIVYDCYDSAWSMINISFGKLIYC